MLQLYVFMVISKLLHFLWHTVRNVFVVFMIFSLKSSVTTVGYRHHFRILTLFSVPSVTHLVLSVL